MNNQWIVVGTALIQKDIICAVSEVSYDKYDEKWSFEVSVLAEQRFISSIGITNKDEDYIRKAHTDLKNTLRG